jgi:hypothetical protein
MDLLKTSLMSPPLAVIKAVSSMNNGMSKFVNIDSTNGVVVLMIVISIILFVVLIFPYATYKLTGCLIQAILCLLFGGFYIGCAWLYYGLTGHKFQ